MKPHAYRFVASAQSGGKLEIQLPELAQGEAVEVIVRRLDADWDGHVDPDHAAEPRRPWLHPREIDRIIMCERQAWEG